MVLGCLPSMYLTSRLARTQAKRETALKVKCFKEAFNWFKWTLSAGAKNQGEVPGGGFPSGLWVCLSGSYPGDEWDFRWLANFQSISNGWSVTNNSTGLQLPVLKQVPKEVSNWLYMWCPKYTWWMIHHLVKKNHLPHRLIWLTPPLRSLNSCCHCLRQVLLLYCWGSRSPAWGLRFVRFLWGIWSNGCEQAGQIGQAQRDVAGHGH